MVMLPEELPKTGKVASAADMAYCPLCKKKFVSFEEPGKDGKAYLCCFDCEISIWVRDPALGRWYNVEPEPCPMCAFKATRLFFRSDGYIKMKCPKCGFIAESVDPQKHDKVMRAEEAQGIRFTPKPLPPEKHE